MNVKASKSNPSLFPPTSKTSSTAFAKRGLGKAGFLKTVSEKGDARALISTDLELKRDDGKPKESNVRRQRSAPSLTNVIPKPIGGLAKAKLESSSIAAVASSSESSSLIPSNEITTNVVFMAKNFVPMDSTPPVPEEPVCSALQKDPKLKALVLSLGINPSGSTLVGPIEKGQLIIATLQEVLQELVKTKTKKTERKGQKFHIQRSGLDLALRALKNAERSLRTIKESKPPVLGRARTQRSSESLIMVHRKTTDAVIRILSSTKEKFDKMGNGLDKLLGGISLVSSLSSPSPPSTTSFSYYSRRQTGTSVLTTPVATSRCPTAVSRARSSTSTGSIGGRIRGGSSYGKLVPINM